jgi:hypothetical protein
MRFIVLALATLVLTATPTEEEAATAGQKWLTLLDNEKYVDSWKEAASMFRDQVGEDQWVASLTQFRQPLGHLAARSVARIDFTRTLRGAPDAEYSIIHFKTDFTKKTAVTERLTLVKENGAWQAAAYAIH